MERDLEMDGEEFFRLKGVLDKLKLKGGRNFLVVIDKVVYIVDVNNDIVVIVVDKGDMFENVFIKIDLILFVN